MRSLAGAAVLVGLIAGTRSAAAQATDPGSIGTTDELERALVAVVDAHQAALTELRRLSERLAETRRAHADKQAAIQPLWTRREEYKRKLAQLDHYLKVEAETTELPPVIAAEEARLQSQARLRESVGGEVPPEEALDREFLASLKTEVATATRTLPGLRPTWASAITKVSDSRAALAKEFESFQAELKGPQDELDTLATALSAAVAAHELQVRVLNQSRLRYFLLRYELQNRFAPSRLAEVRLSAPLDTRPAERLYYHAVLEDSPESLEAMNSIKELEDLMPAVDEEVERSRAFFESREREFKDVSDRWQAKNELYITMTSREYKLTIGLEVCDSLIGLAKDGLSPSSVFCELAWRLGEAGLKDHRIKEPTLNEELLAYRQRVTEQFTSSDGSPVIFYPPTDRMVGTSEEMRREIAKHDAIDLTARDCLEPQIEETIKSTTGAVFSRVCHTMAKGAAGAVDRGLQRADVRAVMALVILESGLKDLPRDGLRTLLGDRQRTRAILIATESGVADALVDRLKKPENAARIAEGFVLSAVVAVGKEGVKNFAGLAAERRRLMTDMVVLDIEWFARRSDYQTAGRLYRMDREIQNYLRSEIAGLYDHLAGAKRSVRVLVNKPFAVRDEIEAELRFTGSVKDVSMTIGPGGEYASSIDSDVKTTFTLKPSGGFSDPGEYVLAVTARGDGGSFDADPTTVPEYAGPTLERPATGKSLWSGRELGPDRSHKVKFEAPSLTLVDPDADHPYVGGDWVGVAYHLPGSLPHQHLHLGILDVSDAAPSFEIPALVNGRMQYQVPVDPPRGIQLRIVRKPKEGLSRPIDAGCKVEVATIVPAVRELPKGPFTTVTQTDLPTRGVWFVPGDGAIPAGKGRLLFERRDAASQLMRPKIHLYPTGSREEFAESWDSECDLPPGSYRAQIDGVPRFIHDNLVVEAGKARRVVTGGYGRLGFHRTDGLGKEIAPKVFIRIAGRPERLYESWDSSVDLPEGSYDVQFDYKVVIEQKNVAVTAGKLTTIGTCGYGRLDVDFIDENGASVSPRRSIYRVGTEDCMCSNDDRLMDLPPGDWELRWSAGGEERKQVVTVRAGVSTPYRIVSKTR